MKTRILSAVVLLPLLIFVLVKGSFYLGAFIMLCTLIGVHEFTNALGEKSSFFTKVILSLSVVILLSATCYNTVYFQKLVLPIMLSILLIQGTLVVFGKITPLDAGMSIFIFLYVGVSMASIYIISSDYKQFFPYIFIISMVTDTFAYFSGVFFGKHKLSPNLSPKKTIEGSIGGIIFCILGSYIYSMNFHYEFLAYVIPFSLVGSIVSQIGDIFASAFKRAMNIKDYGNLIPGHGGILDRADSIIFTTSYIYVIISVID